MGRLILLYFIEMLPRTVSGLWLAFACHIKTPTSTDKLYPIQTALTFVYYSYFNKHLGLFAVCDEHNKDFR